MSLQLHSFFFIYILNKYVLPHTKRKEKGKNYTHPLFLHTNKYLTTTFFERARIIPIAPNLRIGTIQIERST
jgi:hypothetical protein